MKATGHQSVDQNRSGNAVAKRDDTVSELRKQCSLIAVEVAIDEHVKTEVVLATSNEKARCVSGYR